MRLLLALFVIAQAVIFIHAQRLSITTSGLRISPGYGINERARRLSFSNARIKYAVQPRVRLSKRGIPAPDSGRLAEEFEKQVQVIKDQTQALPSAKDVMPLLNKLAPQGSHGWEEAWEQIATLIEGMGENNFVSAGKAAAIIRNKVSVEKLRAQVDKGFNEMIPDMVKNGAGELGRSDVLFLIKKLAPKGSEHYHEMWKQLAFRIEDLANAGVISNSNEATTIIDKLFLIERKTTDPSATMSEKGMYPKIQDYLTNAKKEGAVKTKITYKKVLKYVIDLKTQGAGVMDKGTRSILLVLKKNEKDFQSQFMKGAETN